MDGLKFCSLLFSLVATTLLLTALVSKYWFISFRYYYGLWTFCWTIGSNYICHPHKKKTEALIPVMQALVITATILSIISSIGCIISLSVPKIGHVSVQKMTSFPSLLAGCFSFIAAIVFLTLSTIDLIWEFKEWGYEGNFFLSFPPLFTWLSATLLWLSGLLSLRTPASEV